MRVNIGELGMKDMYKAYKASTPNPLSYKEYKAVNEEYIKEMMELIINQGYTFTLPSRLGSLRVRKTKINYEGKLAIDWGTYNKTGIKSNHLNQHSDGFKIKFFWEKKKAVLKPNAKRPYSFTLSRDLKRSLAKKMKQVDGHTIYPEEIIPFKPLSTTP